MATQTQQVSRSTDSEKLNPLERSGGGLFFPFRDGIPGPVKNLNIIDGSWVYAPVDVNCSVVTPFQAQVVRLDGNGQPVRTGSTIECAGQGN